MGPPCMERVKTALSIKVFLPYEVQQKNNRINVPRASNGMLFIFDSRARDSSYTACSATLALKAVSYWCLFIMAILPYIL